MLLLVASGCRPKEAPPEGPPPAVSRSGLEGPRSDAVRADASAAAVEEPGVRCGAAACAPGETCCNPSCGICVPPGGFCTQQVCDAPTDGAGATAAPPGGSSAAPVRGACRTDADCALYSKYCVDRGPPRGPGGAMPCSCVPHARGAPPTCGGPSVRCLVDPCAEKAAACRDGTCIAKDR